MKFKIPRSNFFKTLSHLQGIVDKKNSLPILANILIEAKDSNLILSSTDMDISIIKNKDKEKSVYEEGCLSVPNQFAEIERPKNCEVEYLNYEGKKKLLKAEGLLATCIQHEMDHLEGVLFIDYLSKLKKNMIIKKLLKNRPDRIVV